MSEQTPPSGGDDSKPPANDEALSPRWEEPRPSGHGSDTGAEGVGSSAGAEGFARSSGTGGSAGMSGARGDEGAEPRPRHPLEENLTKRSTWLRLVFIVVFAIAWSIAELVLTAVVVVQFLVVLFTGEPNERLRGFGQSLSRYAYQLFRYLTFNSDARPFPFDLDWPSRERDPSSS